MNAHYENMPSDEAVRPICAAAADGHHAKVMYDDVPICLSCISLWTESLSSDGLAEWARKKFLERLEAATREAT